MGTNTVGAMVVAGPEGFRKSAYRKFNIKRPETAPGDDFAMMREVLERRFARLEQEDPDRSRGEWPDLLLIDGGKGQVTAVLRDAARSRASTTCRWSASPRGRTAMPGARFSTCPTAANRCCRSIRRCSSTSSGCATRRTASRSARTAQSAPRASSPSPLDDVPGIGPARKKALLMHFGTAKSVKGAALEDLEKAPGISKAMARAIYDYFHPAG